MSAIVTPRTSTPSVCPPTVMMVAACVSCFLFSVNVSPSRVVTSSSSGIGPTVSDDPGPQLAFAAGFISTPTPTSAVAGPTHRARIASTTRIFFSTTAPGGQRSGLSSSDSRNV